MRRTVVCLACGLLFAAACSKRSGGGSARLRSDTDSVAYILGMNIGQNLLRMDSTLNVAAVCEGLRDAFRGTAALTTEEARDYFLGYMNYRLPEKARAYEEQFLEDLVRSNRSYARTGSGVAYTVSELGDQDAVPSADRDTLLLRWVVRSTDGTQLYSSYERGDTLRLALGSLKQGLRESVKLIGEGGRIEAWIPSSAAYGADGEAELGIRPNVTVRFDIELLGVQKQSDWLRRNNSSR